MISLVIVELRRLAARRFLWGLLGLTTVVILISAAFVFTDHESKPDVNLEEQVQAAQAQQEVYEASCIEDIPAADTELCEIPDITAEDIYLDDPRLKAYDIWHEQGHSLVGTTSGFDVSAPLVEGQSKNDGEGGLVFAVLVGWAMLAGVLGAGLIGAEYKAGTIETALLWEPRRLRVLGAKFAAGVLAAAAGTVLLILVLFVALAPTLIMRGTTDGMDADFWRGVVSATARGALIAALAALSGMALATITRGTAGGIAVLYVGLAAAEVFVRSIGSGLSRFLPGYNAVAVILDVDVETFEFDALFDRGQIHGTGTALAVTFVAVAVFMAVAVVAFLRRDVDE